MSSSSIANFRSVPALLAFALTAVVGLSADLISKEVAMRHLAPHGTAFVSSMAAGAEAPGDSDSAETTGKLDRHVIVQQPGEPPVVYRVIPGWLHFQGMLNEGAVFGIGQGQRWFFVVVSILAFAFVLRLFATSGNHRFYQFVLGLVLGGILGNMYDRVAFGYVRDFLYMLPGRTWPGTHREMFPWIFNIADSLLCVGVGLIFIYVFRGVPSARDAKDARGKPEPTV